LRIAAGVNGSTRLVAAVSYVVATFFSLTLLGMSVAPFLLGAAAFVLLYAALGRSSHKASTGDGLLTWLGRHSYSIYLLHHPVVRLLLPPRPEHLRLSSTLARL